MFPLPVTVVVPGVTPVIPLPVLVAVTTVALPFDTVAVKVLEPPFFGKVTLVGAVSEHGTGVGEGDGVGVTVGVGVAVADGVGVAVGYGVGVGVAGIGVGVGVASLGVGVAVGEAIGDADGLPLGEGEATDDGRSEFRVMSPIPASEKISLSSVTSPEPDRLMLLLFWC